MTVYFISGLGADKRAFEKLTLPASWEARHIEWVDNNENETLISYCHRLCLQIDTKAPFLIVGLSFGGIVAVELTKIINPERVIIISSVSMDSELPILYKIFGFFKLDKILPGSSFRKPSSFLYWFFGTKTKEEKHLLKQILENTSPHFAKWAVGKILRWKNPVRPKGLLHIHGTADKIFPYSKTHADIKINGGGHLMVYSHADEISNVL
jgi:hypothetical protein